MILIMARGAYVWLSIGNVKFRLIRHLATKLLLVQIFRRENYE
jgi:hypothetical protein